MIVKNLLFVRIYDDISEAVILSSELIFIDSEILSTYSARRLILASKAYFKKFIYINSSLNNCNQFLLEVKDAVKHIIPYPCNTTQANILYNQILIENDQFDLLTAYSDFEIDEEEKLLVKYFAGNSMAMKNLRGEIIRAARNEAPVLLLGETGVGKTTAARIIHQFSSRREANFITKAASEFHEGLIDSALFGTHEGAYTGAKKRRGVLRSADGGTFFLDEVGLASIELQSKLLLVIESGSFYSMGSDLKINTDVRFIFATNENLKNKISAGTFKRDLYFRMEHNIIHFPSLQDCREDIKTIAEYRCSKFGKTITSEALRKIESYDWPGNMRQLITYIDNACVNKKTDSIEARDIKLEF